MQLPKTQSKIVLFLLLGGALTLLGGCAAMHALKENPRVSVADVRVRDIKPMETVFQLELRIQNPNDVPIDLYGINCEMEVDGRHFASGIADANQTVPAFGTTTVPVSVYASVLDMVSSVVDLIQTSEAASSRGKPVAYLLKGTVIVGVQGVKKEIPVTSSGELSLKGIGRTLNLPHRGAAVFLPEKKSGGGSPAIPLPMARPTALSQRLAALKVSQLSNRPVW